MEQMKPNNVALKSLKLVVDNLVWELRKTILGLLFNHCLSISNKNNKMVKSIYNNRLHKQNKDY